VLLLKQSFRNLPLKFDKSEASARLARRVGDHATVSYGPEVREVVPEVLGSGRRIQPANEDLAADLLARRAPPHAAREEVLE